MSKSEQLNGANFSFQRQPFQWLVHQFREMGFKRMELRATASHLDLFRRSSTRLAELRIMLDGHLADISPYYFEGTLTFASFGNGSYPLNSAVAWCRWRHASAPHFDTAE